MTRTIGIVCGAIAVCLVALSGCAAPVVHNTPSGKVETTIPGVSPDAVKSLLVSEMLNRGYNLTKDSSYMISFDRRVDNVFAAALLGSEYDSTPNARVTYTFAQIGDAVRVIADLAIITNPGSAFERRTELNNSQDSPKIQTLLDGIKAQLSSVS